MVENISDDDMRLLKALDRGDADADSHQNADRIRWLVSLGLLEKASVAALPIENPSAQYRLTPAGKILLSAH